MNTQPKEMSLLTLTIYQQVGSCKTLSELNTKELTILKKKFDEMSVECHQITKELLTRK